MPSAAGRPEAPYETLLRDPRLFQAPSEYVTLKQVHQGGSGPLLIHIQDPHVNLSGQKNLSAALGAILARYDLDLVLVEGGTRDDTLTPIKHIAPPDVWRRVANKFLMEGKIAGEEHLNLISDRPMRIIGIEDRDLYRRSVEAYGRLADERERILAYLAQVRRVIEKIKIRIYPRTLLKYEKNRSVDGFAEASVDVRRLTEAALAAGLDLRTHPDLARTSDLIQKESAIDFDAAHLEQAALADEILRRGAPQEIAQLTQKISAAKGNQAAQLAYFKNIFIIAKLKNINLERFPNLNRYNVYLEEFSRIDIEAVAEQCTALEDELYRKVLTEEDARKLRAIDRFTSLLDLAYRAQMTTRDFEMFVQNKEDFTAPAWAGFLNTQLARYGYTQDLLSRCVELERGQSALTEFYDSVSRRDRAFLENTQKVLTREKRQVAVLISGGYHTSHLKKLFTSIGASFVVLTPLVTGETDQKKYERILLEPLRSGRMPGDEPNADHSYERSAGDDEGGVTLSKRPVDGVRPQPAAESGARLAEITSAARLAAGRPNLRGDANQTGGAPFTFTRSTGARLAESASESKDKVTVTPAVMPQIAQKASPFPHEAGYIVLPAAKKGLGSPVGLAVIRANTKWRSVLPEVLANRLDRRVLQVVAVFGPSGWERLSEDNWLEDSGSPWLDPIRKAVNQATDEEKTAALEYLHSLHVDTDLLDLFRMLYKSGKLPEKLPSSLVSQIRDEYPELSVKDVFTWLTKRITAERDYRRDQLPRLLEWVRRAPEEDVAELREKLKMWFPKEWGEAPTADVSGGPQGVQADEDEMPDPEAVAKDFLENGHTLGPLLHRGKDGYVFSVIKPDGTEDRDRVLKIYPLHHPDYQELSKSLQDGIDTKVVVPFEAAPRLGESDSSSQARAYWQVRVRTGRESWKAMKDASKTETLLNIVRTLDALVSKGAVVLDPRLDNFSVPDGRLLDLGHVIKVQPNGLYQDASGVEAHFFDEREFAHHLLNMLQTLEPVYADLKRSVEDGGSDRASWAESVIQALSPTDGQASTNPYARFLALFWSPEVETNLNIAERLIAYWNSGSRRNDPTVVNQTWQAVLDYLKLTPAQVEASLRAVLSPSQANPGTNVSGARLAQVSADESTQTEAAPRTSLGDIVRALVDDYEKWRTLILSSDSGERRRELAEQLPELVANRPWGAFNEKDFREQLPGLIEKFWPTAEQDQGVRGSDISDIFADAEQVTKILSEKLGGDGWFNVFLGGDGVNAFTALPPALRNRSIVYFMNRATLLPSKELQALKPFLSDNPPIFPDKRGELITNQDIRRNSVDALSERGIVYQIMTELVLTTVNKSPKSSGWHQANISEIFLTEFRKAFKEEIEYGEIERQLGQFLNLGAAIYKNSAPMYSAFLAKQVLLIDDGEKSANRVFPRVAKRIADDYMKRVGPHARTRIVDIAKIGSQQLLLDGAVQYYYSDPLKGGQQITQLFMTAGASVLSSTGLTCPVAATIGYLENYRSVHASLAWTEDPLNPEFAPSSDSRQISALYYLIAAARAAAQKQRLDVDGNREPVPYDDRRSAGARLAAKEAQEPSVVKLEHLDPRAFYFGERFWTFARNSESLIIHSVSDTDDADRQQWIARLKDLQEKPMTIGKASDNNIVLKSRFAEELEASLKLDGGNVIISLKSQFSGYKMISSDTEKRVQILEPDSSGELHIRLFDKEDGAYGLQFTDKESDGYVLYVVNGGLYRIGYRGPYRLSPAETQKLLEMRLDALDDDYPDVTKIAVRMLGYSPPAPSMEPEMLAGEFTVTREVGDLFEVLSERGEIGKKTGPRSPEITIKVSRSFEKENKRCDRITVEETHDTDEASLPIHRRIYEQLIQALMNGEYEYKAIEDQEIDEATLGLADTEVANLKKFRDEISESIIDMRRKLEEARKWMWFNLTDEQITELIEVLYSDFKLVLADQFGGGGRGHALSVVGQYFLLLEKASPQRSKEDRVKALKGLSAYTFFARLFQGRQKVWIPGQGEARTHKRPIAPLWWMLSGEQAVLSTAEKLEDFVKEAQKRTGESPVLIYRHGLQDELSSGRAGMKDPFRRYAVIAYQGQTYVVYRSSTHSRHVQGMEHKAGEWKVLEAIRIGSSGRPGWHFKPVPETLNNLHSSLAQKVNSQVAFLTPADNDCSKRLMRWVRVAGVPMTNKAWQRIYYDGFDQKRLHPQQPVLERYGITSGWDQGGNNAAVGARLAGESAKTPVDLGDFYDVNLSKAFVIDTAQLGGSAIRMLARVWWGLSRSSGLEERRDIPFELSSSRHGYVRFGRTPSVGIYAQDSDTGPPVLVGVIDLTAAVERLNQTGGPHSDSDPYAETTAEQDVPEALKALAEYGLIQRQALLSWEDFSKPGQAQKAVRLLITVDRELPSGEPAILMESLKALRSIAGPNVYYAFVTADGTPHPVYAQNNSDLPDTVDSAQVETIIVGAATAEGLARASELGAGYMPVEKGLLAGAILPYLPTFITAVMIARSEQATDKLLQLLRMLINRDSYVDIGADAFAALKRVPKAPDLKTYKVLTVKAIRKVDLKVFFTYAQMVAKVIGAAA